MMCGFLHAGVLASIALVNAASLAGVAPCPEGRSYTTTEDFLEGQILNLNTNVGGQLEVNAKASPFPFIWVPASSRGTIIKINSDTGQILGEYWSAPQPMAKNPSRTTVDLNGAVWAGNRDEASGGMGSVVQVALNEACDCVDRNGNGVIDTSTGLGDIRPWLNTDGVDTNGGVSTAEDECIVKFVRVNGDHVRHVSVDPNNNVWVAGNFGSDNAFDLLDNVTGAVLASFDVGAGGYGGLVDANGVIWSANRGPGPTTVLRYDTKGTLSTDDDTFTTLNAGNAYGLGIDSTGHVWNSQWTSNSIHKFTPLGDLVFAVPSGGAGEDRGVTVTSDDHVWVANSGGSNVSRLASDGTVLKVISLGADGAAPTGLSVDASGKVWATCLGSHTAKRIDPDAGADRLGEVDLTVSLGPGAGPYNYSDMTGQALISTIAAGTWSVVHDGGVAGAEWLAIAWNEEPCVDQPEPEGTSIVIEVRAAESEAGLGGVAYVTAVNGEPLSGVVGRFIQVRATLDGASDPFQTPVLCDLTIKSGCRLLGDLNCDGQVDNIDLGALLSAWGGQDEAADLNGSGAVDGADLGTLLANWGRCAQG